MSIAAGTRIGTYEVRALIGAGGMGEVYRAHDTRLGRDVALMELVEGPTLAERIATGAIPLDEALPIAKQVADAIEYAHDKNAMHRDLKPANIKVTAEGVVKVLDFGLAKALADARRTRTGGPYTDQRSIELDRRIEVPRASGKEVTVVAAQ